MTGKYGLFIWGSYGLTAAVLLWNILSPLIGRRGVLRRLADATPQDGIDE